MNSITAQSSEAKNLLILYLSALFVILVLAYMDEGYYSFAWMADPGSWVAVILFSGCIFVAEFIVYRMITGWFDRLSRLWVSVLVGTTLALAFLFLIVFPVLQS